MCIRDSVPAKGQDKHTLAAELLDAVIAGIGDVDAAIRSDGQALGRVELARAIAKSAPRQLVDALVAETLDAMVVAVAYVNPPVASDSHPLGRIELARACCLLYTSRCV